MEIITIFKIECMKAPDNNLLGESFSLLPWQENTGELQGEDDGGNDYVLPDGYVLDSKDGSPFIRHTQGHQCELQAYQDKPLLVDRSRRFAMVLERDKKIQHRREMMGMTRERLAELTEINQKELYELENYEKEATTGILRKIAAVLECEIMDLI